ncbi:MAG: aminopeptidase YwaD [Acidobacteriota bacterium]|nr:aminopeptidase YwaD [Acidobacteriota bacterium]
MRQLAATGVGELREEPLSVLAYRPLAASCRVGTAQISLSAVGLQFTASGSATGRAVYLGAPESVDDIRRFEDRGVVLHDVIAVFHCLYPYLLLPYLIERGVAGVVVVSDAPGELISHYAAQMYPPARAPLFDDRPLAVPGVPVNGAQARHLLAEVCNCGAELALEHTAEYVVVDTANVVAEIPGRDPASRVVVGAHYDTQLDCPGGCDNATGIAALLELASLAAKTEPLRTIVFVAFADEEHGFAGSTEYCLAHASELESIVGMVNLDALGWALPAKRALYADPAIRDLAFETASAAGWTPEEELEASIFPGSDHNPFIDAGVPAAFYWRYPPGNPFYHTAGDIPEIVDLHLVSETASVASRLVLRLANDEELAIGRSRPSRRWIDLRPGAETREPSYQEGA